MKIVRLVVDIAVTSDVDVDGLTEVVRWKMVEGFGIGRYAADGGVGRIHWRTAEVEVMGVTPLDHGDGGTISE